MANINGNNSNNSILGTSVADTINARGGNDIVDAGAGNDTIYGGDGNDMITGGLGNDLIDGGAGIDTAVFNGNASLPYNRGVFVNLAAGTSTGGDGTDTLVSIENVIGSSWSDTITGSAVGNVLNGGAGTDVFYASGGIDAIIGGADWDTFRFDGQGAATASLASGTYSFAGGSGTLSGIESFVGSSFGDTLTGDAGVNKFDGMAGNDTLAGGLGNDELWGGAGSDRLIADGGNDMLVGNYSMLNGYGDNASDTFVIATNAGAITVSDFKRGVDKLDLSYFGFNSNGNSSYWTGHSVQSGPDTVMTLAGLNGESVTVTLSGVTDGHLLSVTDMIGGSASLIAPPPGYPINGGNGLADVFVINPLAGNVVIDHFENGLDKLDISAVNGYGGYLANTPDGSAILNFDDGLGHAFTVTLTGQPYWLMDASDYLL